MSELDTTLDPHDFHNHENLPVVAVIPLPSEEQTRQKSFEEVMTEMENKISHLEDYLKKIGEPDEEKHNLTAIDAFTGKFRDWLINTEELPMIMKPFITVRKPFSDKHHSYRSLQLNLLNSKLEMETIYAKFEINNIFFGALGGVGLGYVYNYFNLPSSVYTAQSGWTKDVTKIRVESNIKSLSYMTVVYRVTQRAAIAGFLFDFFKRNAEQATGNVNHWSNSFCSAVICGGLFGALRGGLRGCAMGAAGLSVSSYIWESCPTLHSVT